MLPLPTRRCPSWNPGAFHSPADREPRVRVPVAILNIGKARLGSTLNPTDERFQQEARESRAHGRPTLPALQFRQSSQNLANHARDGGWHRRSRLVAGRNCDVGGCSLPAEEARPLQEIHATLSITDASSARMDHEIEKLRLQVDALIRKGEELAAEARRLIDQSVKLREEIDQNQQS